MKPARMNFPQSTIALQRALDNCTELRHRAVRTDVTSGERTLGPMLRYKAAHESVMTTTRCGARGCKWCDYKLRSRHKRKLERISGLVTKNPKRWRFFTFTLPGTLFEVRKSPLNLQLETMRGALRKFWDRQRDKRGSNPLRFGRPTGSYVIEHPYNVEKEWWHLHTHALIRTPPEFDLKFEDRMVRYNRQWLECVDKSRTLELLKEGVQLRDLGSPIDVEKVTVDGLAGYMTKATGYMAKGHGKSDTSLKDEVSQVMKGRHVFGTWGDLRGTKFGRIKE